MNNHINIDNIDYDRLREDLKNYFGTGMIINPGMVIELSKVEKSSNNELIKIAVYNGFDLTDYYINNYRKTKEHLYKQMFFYFK